MKVLEQTARAYEATGGSFDRDVAAYACHGGYRKAVALEGAIST